MATTTLQTMTFTSHLPEFSAGRLCLGDCDASMRHKGFRLSAGELGERAGANDTWH
jgi:hypothetical protein